VFLHIHNANQDIFPHKIAQNTFQILLTMSINSDLKRTQEVY
jgi:hypothetical protein